MIYIEIKKSKTLKNTVILYSYMDLAGDKLRDFKVYRFITALRGGHLDRCLCHQDHYSAERVHFVREFLSRD